MNTNNRKQSAILATDFQKAGKFELNSADLSPGSKSWSDRPIGSCFRSNNLAETSLKAGQVVEIEPKTRIWGKAADLTGDTS